MINLYCFKSSKQRRTREEIWDSGIKLTALRFQTVERHENIWPPRRGDKKKKKRRSKEEEEGQFRRGRIRQMFDKFDKFIS